MDTEKNLSKPVATAILSTGALSSVIVWQTLAASAITISDPRLMIVFAPLSLSIAIYLILYGTCLKKDN